MRGSCSETSTSEPAVAETQRASCSHAAARQFAECAVDGVDLPHALETFSCAVREASKIASIGSIFHGLESTLPPLEAIIKDSESSSIPKEIIGDLIDQMQRGAELVCRYAGRGRFVHLNQHHHEKKLQKLQDEIARLFQLYIPLRNCHDSKELLLEAKDLCAEIRKLNNFTQIKCRRNVERTGGFESIEVPKEPSFIVGLHDHKLKGQLLEGGVSVLVVSGPGGFGKTTLVEKLGHDPDIEGKFKKNIFFINVSKSPSFIAIVQKLVQFHRTGLDVPNIETEDEAIHQLQELLTRIGNSPVLLILDDLPAQSCSLLEKFVFRQIPDYKILVTSRFEFPRFGPSHQLSRLNSEDARELFLHSAIPQFGNPPPPPNDELTEKIVELCKGSPLALTLVGKSLCGKHPSIWRSRLLEWSEDPSFADSGSEILNRLGKTSRRE